MKFQIERGFTRLFYDSLLCIAIYLFCVSLPMPPFLDQESFTGALRYLALPIIGLILAADHISPWDDKVRRAWLCIPIVFIAFGNMLSLWISGGGSTPSADVLTRAFFFTLATATAEEAVFRFGLIEALDKTSLKKYDFIAAALIFGVCHIFNILGGAAILPTLAQAGYTFLFGLLLGVAYKVGGILPAIALHFVFNFLQNDLYTACGGGVWDFTFFACNIGCFLLAAAAAFFLWWRYIRIRKSSI